MSSRTVSRTCARDSLGIGTAAPTSKLHVVGGEPSLLRVEQTSSSFNPVLELKDASASQNRSPAINFLNAVGQVPGQVLYLDRLEHHDV